MSTDITAILQPTEIFANMAEQANAQNLGFTERDLPNEKSSTNSAGGASYPESHSTKTFTGEQ